MNRRSFLKSFTFTTAYGLSALRMQPLQPSNARKKPNILLFVADDLGWGDVGYHGSKNRTPTIDRLVKQGVELDQHYVCPQCTPTRLSLLTGRYSSRFGVNAATNSPAMPLGTHTIASNLKKSGYETFISGKWHLGSDYEHGPNKYGFDYSYGNMTGACHPFDHTYRKGRFERTWHRNGRRIDQKGHTTDLITQETIHWMIQQKAGPWFVYVPFTAVHTPIGAPKQWIDSYKDVRFDNDPRIDESKRRYAAMVSHMDDAIRRIIETVGKSGFLENTLVIFFSDNGSFYLSEPSGQEYGGDPPLISYAVGTNKPLRGEKSTTYEGGIRTPAFVYWKGKLPPRKVTAPLAAVDWMPTLMHQIGYQPKEDPQWDGLNIWPLLTGEVTDSKPRTIYTRYDAGMNAIRHGDWKLVTMGTSDWARKQMPGEDRSDKLFNILRDPYETTNLAGQHPEILSKLQKMVAGEMEKDEREIRRLWGGS